MKQSDLWTNEWRSLKLARSSRGKNRRTDVGGQKSTHVVDDDSGQREEHEGQDQHDAVSSCRLRYRNNR